MPVVEGERLRLQVEVALVAVDLHERPGLDKLAIKKAIFCLKGSDV